MVLRSSENHPARSGVQSGKRLARSDRARFEKLYEIFARLAACNDLDSVLREVLDASIDAAGADAGYIRFFDLEEADPLSSRYPFGAYKGLSSEYVEYFGSLSQPVVPAQRLALFQGQRTLLEDMFTDPAFEPHREIVLAEGYRMLQGTPLMSRSGSRCVGAIATYFRDIHTPSAASLETLDLLAEVAASTIDNYRRIEELGRSERSWAATVEKQAEALRWTHERLNELEESAPRLHFRELAQRAHSIALRLDEAESARPGEPDAVSDEQYVDIPYGLSPSEVDVLINASRGLSDKETAAQMGVSRFTVAKYLGSALRKLNVEDRSQASVLVERDILSRDGRLNLPFGELLRMFRRRSELTQAELAERAGLSERTISGLERGVRTKVYISTVSLISTALDLGKEDATALAASVDRSRKSRLRDSTSPEDPIR